MANIRSEGHLDLATGRALITDHQPLLVYLVIATLLSLLLSCVHGFPDVLRPLACPLLFSGIMSSLLYLG